MSMLAPFYLLGLAAISLPLVFHLIRRTPRGETPFSSLMFLRPSPPRLTKRSRLDNLLLLLLRALALACLAVAFTRPFFRQLALATPASAERQRVAVLVDTSASMRRGDLWRQAVAAVDATLAEHRPQDRFAVYAFDETLRPIAGFDDLKEVDPARRRQAVASQLRQVEPTWSGTHLGQAVADAVSMLQDAGEDGGADAASRVVLISDLQSGGRLNVLGEHDWPKNVVLELVPLLPADPTNAGLGLLGRVEAQTVEDARDQRLRVRVTNAGGSATDNFRLRWWGPNDQSLGDPIEVYAPAGESRVARVTPLGASAAQLRLTLEGDAHDFDNTVYYLPLPARTVSVGYLGSDDASDPQGMAYYLQRALESDGSRTAQISCIGPDAPAVVGDQSPQLLVVAAPPSSQQAKDLRRYAQQGGLVLYVVTSSNDAGPLAGLLGTEQLQIDDVEPADYAMLSQIDFGHPLFAAMAGPQFNNFTQILFWRYRRLEDASVTGAAILARFDSGDPAILQKRVGAGEVVVMTAGWNPDDSQLARSWKFPLMLSSLVDSREQTALAPSYQVNQTARLPSGIDLPAHAALTKPNGNATPLANHDRTIDELDQPGVYRLETSDGPLEFAVHLDPLESNTEPLPDEAFEQVGAQLSAQFDAAAADASLQQVRDVELEGRQKVWKWLVAFALVLLIAETAIAGWLSRRGESSLAPA